jgi:4-hydroxy-3-polyprenylbenzoate decarboxylase
MPSSESARPPITDLRSALRRLAGVPGQLIETDHPVDPNGELAGVYRHIGAGGTVMRPTRTGPAMMFNSITGFGDVRVLVGLTASRERVGILFGSPLNRLTQRMAEAYRDAMAPVKFSGGQAPCQQVVHRADEPGFDLRKTVPAPTNTDKDAGPFFCLGLVLGSDPELGTEVTIHRLCVQGPDEMSIFFAPSRHIDAFRTGSVPAGRPCGRPRPPSWTGPPASATGSMPCSKRPWSGRVPPCAPACSRSGSDGRRMRSWP